jgi:hypothetical protein
MFRPLNSHIQGDLSTKSYVLPTHQFMCTVLTLQTFHNSIHKIQKERHHGYYSVDKFIDKIQFFRGKSTPRVAASVHTTACTVDFEL